MGGNRGRWGIAAESDNSNKLLEKGFKEKQTGFPALQSCFEIFVIH